MFNLQIEPKSQFFREFYSTFDSSLFSHLSSFSHYYICYCFLCCNPAMDDENNTKVELPLEKEGEESRQSTENSKKKKEIGCVEENDLSRPLKNSSSISVKGEELNKIASSPAKTLAEVPSASGDLHCSYGTSLLCLFFFFVLSTKSCLYFLDY